MSGPLEGIKAVEWAAYANSPIVGVMLGDFGADIIKIEERGVGEPLRGMKRMHGTDLNVGGGKKGTGINAAVENTNRNKRSLSLDLKKEKGREIAHKLIERADVFYTNYGQTRATKVGLDYGTLSKINPQLIYSNNTGYGHRGPDSEARVFDTAAQARSGFMNAIGERNTPPSVAVGTPADTLGATMATLGILAALVGRERKGIGQMTNTSLLGSAIWIQMINIQTALLRNKPREHMGMSRHLRTKPGNPMVNHYKCADGKWIALCEPPFMKYWGVFCDVVGIDVPEYRNLKMEDLREGDTMGRLISYLDERFATQTRDEWVRTFKENNVEFVYAPVNEVNDLLVDPQVLENNYFVDFDHPIVGPVKMVGSPVEFSRTPAGIRSAAPEYGQHTEEILLELGYGWDDITRLQDEEVI